LQNLEINHILTHIFLKVDHSICALQLFACKLESSNAHTHRDGMGEQESISPTFYKQLYCQMRKRHWWLDCLFALLGSAHVKALHKHVGEIDPRSKLTRLMSLVEKLLWKTIRDQRFLSFRACISLILDKLNRYLEVN